MQLEKLRELLARPGQAGVLSTTDSRGEVNGAVFGSARLNDDGELVLALGQNRSLGYLQENPRAVFTVFTPGPHPLAWEGARLYLQAARIEREGPLLEGLREEIRRAAGEGAARRIRAAVVFRVTHLRPLIDLFP